MHFFMRKATSDILQHQHPPIAVVIIIASATTTTTAIIVVAIVITIIIIIGHPNHHRHQNPHAPSAGIPKGFNPVQDLNDNYQFLYPFGWQEVTIDGADVVYKVRPRQGTATCCGGSTREVLIAYGVTEPQQVGVSSSAPASPGLRGRGRGTCEVQGEAWRQQMAVGPCSSLPACGA